MANIQPIQVWVDGSLKTAAQILVISRDDLSKVAQFYYELREADTTGVDKEGNEEFVPGALVSTGNVSMSGPDYENWNNATGDINKAAYEYVAGKLGLTLI